MKIIITVINILSVIPILLYPFLSILGVMSFDTPGSEKNILAWIIFIIVLGYPVLIIAFIILSRMYNSTSFALVALVPLFFLGYLLFFSGNTAQKNNYENLHRDFVCNKDSFLSISYPENPISRIYLYEKKMFKYREEDIASIYEQKWVLPNNINNKEVREKIPGLLTDCRNEEGKSLIDIFTLIDEQEYKEKASQWKKEKKRF